MRTIYKYSFDKEFPACYGSFEIEMPIGVRILSVAPEGTKVMIWALVDTDKPLETVRFRIVGTGHELPSDKPFYFVATFFEKPFVWHLFSAQQPVKPD